MKLLVLLSLLLVLSCEQHKEEPKVEDLNPSLSMVLRDSISGEFYSTDTLWTDSISFSFYIVRDGEYELSLNGEKSLLWLTQGNQRLSFALDQFAEEDSISLLLGDWNFPREIQKSVVLIKSDSIPSVLNLHWNYSYYLTDSLGSFLLSPDSVLIEEYSMTFRVNLPGIYDVKFGDRDTSLLLNSGLQELTWSWDTIMVDTIISVSFVEERYPQDAVESSISLYVGGIPSILQFKVENELFFKTDENILYSLAGKIEDTLRFSFFVNKAAQYSLSLNDWDTTVELNTGMIELAYPLERFVVSDSIEITLEHDLFLDSSLMYTVEIRDGEKPTFTDPYLSYAWQFVAPDSVMDAEKSIASGAHSYLTGAWFQARGRGVKVAIIDIDFERDHEDLSANVIDVHNALTGTDTLMNPNSIFHGTGVAGLVGAVPDNDVGVVGTAPEAELILIDAPTGGISETIRAFEYARDQGAQVINCSWGTYDVQQPVVDIIEELYNDGIAIFFAAGNFGRDMDSPSVVDESELPTVIGIGSSDKDNDYWSGSDFGSNLDIIAPGGSGELGVLRIDGMGDNYGLNKQLGYVNSNYAFDNGCSYASPIAAGVAALMLEVNPTLSPDDIREILIRSADKVGGDAANYVEGFDKRRFYGKLNAARAVELARTW